MTKSLFDLRRELRLPLGLPREFKQTPIFDPAHMALFRLDSVQALIDSDETPIPAPEDREGYYGTRHLEYWLSGYADWIKLRPFMDNRGRYLDLGGASGRVMRHAVRVPGLECWLTDINVNLVEWVDKYFAYPVHVYQSRVIPSLPFEDNSFAAISGFSVFTHLDNDEIQWLLELRRILKPGGHLYLTINDENVWALLDNPNWKWLSDSINRGKRQSEFDALVKRPLIKDRLVWEYAETEVYNVNVFLSSNYVRCKWGRFFDIASYRIAGHGYQSVVVLKKRSERGNSRHDART
jgi:SAM-dependent methyltransferase